MIEGVREIADAVMYEGFLLFPYHKRALKNRMPFQFGVIMPRGYADPSESNEFRCEFALAGNPETSMRGLLRFLEVAEEAIEREIAIEFDVASAHREQPFAIGEVTGSVTLQAQNHAPGARIVLTVRNDSIIDRTADRNAALRKAMVSAHVVLEAFRGEFVSLTDPPGDAAGLAAACTNDRYFPVLAGEGTAGGHSAALLLVSPIVLYDFPKVAQMSRGPTFDGSEIDQLLSLSVAALSDEERVQARAAHPEVARMVDRAEALTIAPGWRVRVRPKGRADVWDGIVDGKIARVVDVKTDVDGKRYVGVLFDDDPASEMHEWYGRSFFYGVDELEPLT